MRLIHAEGISDYEIKASIEIAKVVREIKFQAIQIPENSSLLWDYKGLEPLFCAIDWKYSVGLKVGHTGKRIWNGLLFLQPLSANLKIRPKYVLKTNEWKLWVRILEERFHSTPKLVYPIAWYDLVPLSNRAKY